MASHILWQNAERTITLLDIPRSIVEAQGFNNPDHHELLSAQPRDTPYPSCEPKSAKARAKLVDNSVDYGLHAEYRELLTQALREVTQCHCGDWCLPRPFVEETQPRKKRKLDEYGEASGSQAHALEKEREPIANRCLPDHFLSAFARLPPKGQRVSVKLADGSQVEENDACVQLNGSNEQAMLSISRTDQPDAETLDFRMPPRSAFYLGDCIASYDFRKAMREHARQQSNRSTFDFILLDPPWPNRSIKRTHKSGGATYKTIATLDDLGNMIFDMQLDSMMTEGALVGVWITNKQAARELVLGLGGLFESWGVDLVEEWIWLKTTISGEPTSVLDALWKKPYEVLLLGRKLKAYADDGQDQSRRLVKRRVIAAVPNLHSRKPCLKRLIEPLLPDAEDYTALEVFARHLVAGWCSWGDECIKFNWKGYWNEREKP